MGELGIAEKVEEAASDQLLRKLAALQVRCTECMSLSAPACIIAAIISFAMRLLVALLGS